MPNLKVVTFTVCLEVGEQEQWGLSLKTHKGWADTKDKKPNIYIYEQKMTTSANVQ